MRAVASAEFSPQSCARIGGILYLLIIGAGLFAQAFVRDRLVVPGDAAVTATNIKGHAFLLRVGAGIHRRTIICSMADGEGRECG